MASSSSSAPSGNGNNNGITTMFKVHVDKDTFKFNAAHFVAYSGFRERLHGHNYRVAVQLLGHRKIGPDGYVIDFGCIKKVTKDVCKELNEHFLCPSLSDVIAISVGAPFEESVTLTCEDGSVFVFPQSDVAMLPIVHATTEELAIYLWGRILQGLDANYLIKRGIHTMEVTVAEAPGQDATFRQEIPLDGNNDSGIFDVKHYIMTGNVVPMPCPSNPARTTTTAQVSKDCVNCSNCQSDLSCKLQRIVDAMNSGRLKEPVTAADLEKLMNNYKKES